MPQIELICFFSYLLSFTLDTPIFSANPQSHQLQSFYGASPKSCMSYYSIHQTFKPINIKRPSANLSFLAASMRWHYWREKDFASGYFVADGYPLQNHEKNRSREMSLPYSRQGYRISQCEFKHIMGQENNSRRNCKNNRIRNEATLIKMLKLDNNDRELKTWRKGDLRCHKSENIKECKANIKRQNIIFKYGVIKKYIQDTLKTWKIVMAQVWLLIHTNYFEIFLNSQNPQFKQNPSGNMFQPRWLKTPADSIIQINSTHCMNKN